MCRDYIALFMFLTFHMYLLAYMLPSRGLNLSRMLCIPLYLPDRQRGKDMYCYEIVVEMLRGYISKRKKIKKTHITLELAASASFTTF